MKLTRENIRNCFEEICGFDYSPLTNKTGGRPFGWITLSVYENARGEVFHSTDLFTSVQHAEQEIFTNTLKGLSLVNLKIFTWNADYTFEKEF